MKNVLKVSVLLALFVGVSACTSVEYVPTSPQCTPAPPPVLPELDRGEMWDRLGDRDYRRLESYIDRLWAYADENAVIVENLCSTEEA